MLRSCRLTLAAAKRSLRDQFQLQVLRHQQTASKMEKFDLPQRLQGSTPSVWNEYIALAMQYKPLNLGQGFPDDAAPEYVTHSLADIAKDENPLLHQYTRGYGHVRLVYALSKLYSGLVGQQLNPLSDILITSGAYEALYSTIMGHVDVGDEVIIIEPFFDCYEPMVKMAGGVPRFIPLKLVGNLIEKQKLDPVLKCSYFSARQMVPLAQQTGCWTIPNSRACSTRKPR